MKTICATLLGLGLLVSGPLSPCPAGADGIFAGRALAAGTFAKMPGSGASPGTSPRTSGGTPSGAPGNSSSGAPGGESGGAVARAPGNGEMRPEDWSDVPVDASGSVEDFRRNLMRAMDTDRRTRDEARAMIHGIYFMRAKGNGVAEPFANGRPEADLSGVFGWFQAIAEQTNEFSPRSVARIYLALRAEHPRFHEEYERGWRPAVIAAGNAAHKENALSERLEGVKKMSEDLME